MCLTEYDEERAIRGWKQDGIEMGRIEAAQKLLADGKYTAEEISALLGIPVETFAEPANSQA